MSYCQQRGQGGDGRGGLEREGTGIDDREAWANVVGSLASYPVLISIPTSLSRRRNGNRDWSKASGLSVSHSEALQVQLQSVWAVQWRGRRVRRRPSHYTQCQEDTRLAPAILKTTAETDKVTHKDLLPQWSQQHHTASCRPRGRPAVGSYASMDSPCTVLF